MKRLAALLLVFAAFAARAACEPGGMGGTGIRSDGGIGGTGIQASNDVGLIGVITAFGSICVNGIEVQYDARTPVSADGAAASPSALALGQLVAVRAAANGAQAQAQDIQILHAVVGRVTAFNAAAGQLEVAGQRVRLDSSTVLASTAPADLVGQNVRVSGLWRADGSVAATRIERAEPDATPRVGAREWPDLGTRRLVVEGYVAELGAGSVRVGGLNFGADSRVARELETDRRVRISGHVERDGRRVIERVDLQRPERPERSERLERSDSDNRGPGRADRPERIERPDRGDRPERPERPDRSGPH
jgi:hypothetical protein